MRWIRAALLTFGVLAIVGVLGGGAAFYVTSQSNFCRSCHIMEPYFQSWTRSPHAKVECTRCHMPPDLQGKFMTKFQALNQLTKYVTKTYGSRPWGHVADASCLECHDLGKLKASPRREFKPGLLFAHGPHLEGKARNAVMRCSTCHTRVDRSTHMQVSTASCFTCHFMAGATGARTDQARCNTCHTPSMAASSMTSAVLGHGALAIRAITAGADCASCHKGVVQGDASVPRIRCTQCHDDDKVQELRKSPERLHEVHVTKAGTPCLQCHLEITHKRPTEVPVDPKGDCRQCHGQAHGEQGELFTGRLGVQGSPSAMFRSGLECSSCHVTGAKGPGAGMQVKPSGCAQCHSDRLAGMAPMWNEEATRLARTLSARASQLATAGPDPAIQTQARRVGSDLDALVRAHPIHNLPHARALLESSAARLDALGRDNGGTRLLTYRIWDQGGKCLDCHFPMALSATTARGEAMSHEAHARALPRKSCDTCHATGSTHGRLVEAATCTSCHHPVAPKGKTPECKSCHGPQRQVFAGMVWPGGQAAPGPLSKDKGCTDCHGSGGAKQSLKEHLSRCETCHDPGTDKDFATRLKPISDRLDALRARLSSPAGVPNTTMDLWRLLESDGSRGAHNPAYFDAGLRRIEATIPAR